MEREEREVTLEKVLALTKIYNSKIKSFSRSSLCPIIGISIDNSFSYNSTIEIMKHNEIIIGKKQKVQGFEIMIDRDKLEEFIRGTKLFLLMEEFIHKSLLGAIT